MNGALLLVAGIALYAVAYRFYGGFLERKLVKPNDEVQTPAYSRRDGTDYCPAKSPVLFGHHFSSIAGAGPILGPVIGVFHFGWAAVSLWVIMGSIFIGAVHDYLSLMVSVRSEGESMAEAAKNTIGNGARVAFSVFVYAGLVLVITAFGNAAAKTLIARGELVIPTFGLIFVAMVAGFMIYKTKLPLWASTVVALGLVVLCIVLGGLKPLPLQNEEGALKIWFTVLIAYGGIASLLPVWFLLQPRDYLSSYFLFAGIGLGCLGVFVTHPVLAWPAWRSFQSQQGPLWPMMGVIVACGAISGFHSLVAGGTTSKQLDKETEGKKIGYGSMLVEGALALIVVVAVAGGLSQLEFKEAFSVGWIEAYGQGFAALIAKLGIPEKLGSLFAILVVNAFVLTTLDTSVRICRFVVQESFGDYVNPLRNKYAATALAIGPALLLGLTNKLGDIWPVFGSANQLIAALALIVISCYLVGVKRPATYTLIPAIIMLLTTLAALGYKGWTFFHPEEGDPKRLLASICLALMLLAIYVAVSAGQALSRLKRDGSRGVGVQG